MRKTQPTADVFEDGVRVTSHSVWFPEIGKGKELIQRECSLAYTLILA